MNTKNKNQVIPFNYGDSLIRTVEDVNGEPLWIAKDICEVLQYKEVSKTLSKLDDDEKGTTKVRTLGGLQDMICINESGLYSLILRSNKPEAKKFKKWVTSEVLPTIRKTGTYNMSMQNTDLTPALLEMTKSITTISKNMNTLLSSTINTSNEVNRMKADIREIKEQISQPTVTPKNTETLDIEKAIQIVSKLNKTVTEVVVDNELMSLWNVSFDEYSLIYIIAVSKRWSEKKIINDKEYIHMYHAKFQELMPKPRHERQVRRSIAKLVDKGLIEKVVLLNKGYYKLTALSKKLEDKLEVA